MISPEEQSAVSIGVMLLTQVIKWSKVLPERATIFVVFVLSGLGVTAIVYDHALTERVSALTIICLFANLVATSAGVYGMAKGSVETVASMRPDPEPPSSNPPPPPFS